MSDDKATRCSVCGSEVTDAERPRRPEPPRRLPLSFQDATWHGTVPVDEHIGRLGVSLRVGGGAVVRYALPVEDARHIAETFELYLNPPGSISRLIARLRAWWHRPIKVHGSNSPPLVHAALRHREIDTTRRPCDDSVHYDS